MNTGETDGPSSCWPMLVRVALVFAATTLVYIAVYEVLGGWLRGTVYSRPAHVAMAVVALASVTGVVAAATRFLDREPPAVDVLASGRGRRCFVVGFVAWLVPASVALAGFMAAGTVTVTLDLTLWQIAAAVLTQLALVFALEAFPEELVFRGYIYRHLATRFSTWAAIAGQAALFTLAAVLLRGYNGPMEALRFLAVGAALGYIRAITGNIWTGVGVHLSFQTVAQLLAAGHVAGIAAAQTGLVEAAALGVIPFTIGVVAIEWITRRRPRWLGGPAPK